MSHKSAIYTGKSTDINGKELAYQYKISQNDSGTVFIEPRSTKSQFRLLAKTAGFAYDSEWDANAFGAKLIEFINAQDSNTKADNQAIFKGENNWYKHTIEQSDNKKFMIVRPDSTKAILRLIFKDWGKEFDKTWNTQTMGSKLIDLINDSPEINDWHYEYFDEIGDEKADEDWEWWLNLNPNMKFIFLYNIKEDLEADAEKGRLERDEDDYLCIYYDEEIQNNRAYMGYWVTDYFAGDMMSYLDISEASQSEISGDIEYCFEGFGDLAYCTNITEISFYFDDSLTFIPAGLNKVKNLERLDFRRTNAFEEEPGEDWEKLVAIARSLPQLEFLGLPSSVEDTLDDEQLDELKALLPNCEIEFY